MKLSRRKLLQVAAPAALASSEVAAQAPQDADAEGARQALRVSAQITRQVALPMATEPATRFIPRS